MNNKSEEYGVKGTTCHVEMAGGRRPRGGVAVLFGRSEFTLGRSEFTLGLRAITEHEVETRARLRLELGSGKGLGLRVQG